MRFRPRSIEAWQVKEGRGTCHEAHVFAPDFATPHVHLNFQDSQGNDVIVGVSDNDWISHRGEKHQVYTDAEFNDRFEPDV